MQESDLSEVLEIEKEAFGSQSRHDFVDCMQKPIYSYMVLRDDSELVGYYGTMTIGYESEILTIAVKAGLRRRGYGEMMLDNIIATAKFNGCKVIYLEVNEKNTIAYNLYLKKGFIESYRRNEYYGKDDALILKLEL